MSGHRQAPRRTGSITPMTVSGHCAFPSPTSHQFCHSLVEAGTIVCACTCHGDLAATRQARFTEPVDNAVDNLPVG